MKNANRKKISVIVPVYKVEDCLERCLNSLCRQSLRDIEIILVDDASPDRCGNICEEYAAKDVGFKVIHHLENKGLSAARNTGIANATCDYLMFVDSDDYVHKDFCKLPYECAVRYQADLVMFRFQYVSDKKIHFLRSSILYFFPKKSTALLGNGYKDKIESIELLHNDVQDYVWNKLYHKNVFKDIVYPVGFLYEDIGTTYKTILKANRIYYLNKVLYYNCYFTGSITTTKTEKALKDKIEMSLQQYNDLAEWGEFSPEKLDMYLKGIALFYCIHKKKNDSDTKYTFFASMLRFSKIIPVDFSLGRKFLFILLKFSPSLFELICTLCGRKYC